MQFVGGSLLLSLLWEWRRMDRAGWLEALLLFVLFTISIWWRRAGAAGMHGTLTWRQGGGSRLRLLVRLQHNQNIPTYETLYLLAGQLVFDLERLSASIAL